MVFFKKVIDYQYSPIRKILHQNRAKDYNFKKMPFFMGIICEK